MARSNGPLTPPGAGRTPRPDPQNWAQGTPTRQPAPRSPQQSQFTPQSAGAAYQQAAYGGQQPATDPRYARSQAEQRPAAAATPRANPQSSAFDSFVAQQAPSQAPAYETTAGRQAGYDTTAGRQAGYAQPAAPSNFSAGGYNGDFTQRTAAAPADQNGFGQWSNAAPAADARGFDYGGYGAAAPAATPAQGGYGNQNGYGQLAPQNGADNGYYAQDDWNQGEAFEQEPSLDPAYGQQGYGHDQQGAIEQSYEDDDDEDEPRSRRKLPLIAAAVIGALVCGGGLAYGYKTFLGPVASNSATPLIKTSSIPSKVKPDDPGGRKFAHSEPTIMGGSSSNKVMGEPLTDGGPGSAGEPAKKVQTVEVRPDGSVVPQSATDARPPAQANSMSMDFPSAGDTGSPDGPSPGGQNFSSSAGNAPPQVITKAERSPPPSQASTSDSIADEAPPVAAPKKVQSKKVAAVAPASDAAALTPAPSGAGWVAVLASVPVSSSSQMDSLKQFADMQQKYGDVLGDKTPSVQEANLGEKGRYHRLVVGPPASRDSASSICGSLKTAGYSGCWVMQY